MNLNFRLTLLCSLLLVAALLPARGADTVSAGHIVTSSSAPARQAYARGLRLLHLGHPAQALDAFKAAREADPHFAMAWWGASRAFHRLNRLPEALEAAGYASDAAVGVDERESRLIAIWKQALEPAGDKAADERQVALEREADTAIALFPEDPEVWLLRAEIAATPLRGAPYLLAVRKLSPEHPIRLTPLPAAPPLVRVEPEITQPAPALAEAPKLFEGLGALSYSISTKNPQAQAFFEQGLRCLHSYVTQERSKNGAADSFQHAALLDPSAPMPYWGLSFCDTKAMTKEAAANRALDLAMRRGNDREYAVCLARVLELRWRDQESKAGALRRRAAEKKDEAEMLRGEIDELTRQAARSAEEFRDVLEGTILSYPEDVELWVWRGKSERSFYGAAGNQVASIPFELAALLFQPEHPGANHELVHLYEAIDRPALGWPYTVGYRRSAPNMPHANHMQAHLAMRLGRWEMALEATRDSRKKSLEGYPELEPGHHIDIMVRALAHQGRFAEAESEPKAYRDGLPWARLLQLKMDAPALREWVERRAKAKSPDADYVGAIAALDAGDVAAAKPLLEKVEAQAEKNKGNFNYYRMAEVKGRWLMQSGQAAEGLKLLEEAAAKVVKDAGAHAWGGGGYLLEVWGETALRAGKLDVAEEAFHEALAHEHGSVLGAIGMQVVWERRGDREMAEHYAARARLAWAGADAGAFERQLARVRALGATENRTVALQRPMVEE